MLKLDLLVPLFKWNHFLEYYILVYTIVMTRGYAILRHSMFSFLPSLNYLAHRMGYHHP